MGFTTSVALQAALSQHQAEEPFPPFVYMYMAVKPGHSTKAHNSSFKCLRYIFRVQWPNIVSNEELIMTNMERIVTSVMCRKWRWIGHTLRRDSNIDMARQALNYQPQRKRKVGRSRNDQKQSMLQHELERVGYPLERAKALAKNCVHLRVLVDVLCFPGVIGNL